MDEIIQRIVDLSDERCLVCGCEESEGELFTCPECGNRQYENTNGGVSVRPVGTGDYFETKHPILFFVQLSYWRGALGYD